VSLTKVSPSLFATSNNITSVTVGGSANTISLTFDASGVITSASNNAVSVANTAITGNIISSQITSVANTQISGNIISSQISPSVTLNGNTTIASGNLTVGGLVRSSVDGFQIGNTTDSYAKFVYDTGTAQLDVTNQYNSGGAGSTYGQIVFKNYNSNGGSLTERMRLTGGGAFVVGNTSISAIQSGGAGFYATRNNDCGFGTNGTSALGAITFYNPNGGVGSIQTSGSSTIYNTGSDYRLKENIQPMTNALAKVAQLKPCTYKWKFDGTDGEGFIAHELAEVFPIAVSGEKDEMQTYTDDNGNEQTRPKWQGVDASFLVGALTGAIQELKAINDTQAETINTLSSTITALTARVAALES
jgi:hypothetical protein